MSATIRAGTLVGPVEMTGDQMVAAMDAVGVDGAVLVSPFSMYRYDSSYVLEVQAKHPDRFCLVKPVDPNGPCRCRHHRRLEGEEGYGRRPGHHARQRLDRSSRPRRQPGSCGGGEAFTGGKPAVLGPVGNRRDNWRLANRTRGSSSTTWAYSSRSSRHRRRSLGPNCRRCWRSAAYPNVAIKITGACTLAHEPFPYRDNWDPLGRMFDAFGFDRCMWGTDWTRAVKLLTYAEGVDAFRLAQLSDSDRAKLMGGTLSRIYDWSPAKA